MTVNEQEIVQANESLAEEIAVERPLFDCEELPFMTQDDLESMSIEEL